MKPILVTFSPAEFRRRWPIACEPDGPATKRVNGSLFGVPFVFIWEPRELWGMLAFSIRGRAFWFEAGSKR